ncbi:putative polyketide synthase [Actinoplanes sp. N902-109]|nr:putative polyketide synthase [Actinoplanes sp. N902-109]
MVRADLVKSLSVILREHAERLGDKIAYEDDDRAVTYAELEARTGRLAGHLIDAGLRRGDRVALCLGNTVAMVEGYLATVRAGGVGVPLNPYAGRRELAFVMSDSGARYVLTTAALAGEFVSAPGRPVVLTTGTAAARRSPGEHTAGTLSFDDLAVTEPVATAPDDLGLDEIAWMFYTSGTTGQPKGVLSSQRNCLWSVASCYVPIPELSAADRVLWPLPLFHSLSHIACVLSVTAVGATARIMDGQSADDVLELLHTQRSTFLAGVPTTYHRLVEARRLDDRELPGLRIGLVGGAVTGPELRRAFEQSFGVPLVDAYGSTETCGAITMNPPGSAGPDGSCGKPVPGVDVRIVDPATGEETQPGAEGEVWVRGPSVMAGYHNDPEATAAALRDGWFHTGDLARRDAAGYVTICGRIKDLIIRGGENIHPEAIEPVLRDAGGVADAGVSGSADEVLGEVPVAYVRPGPGGLDLDALLDHCRAQLAPAELPEEIREVRAIPRTPSGKISRRRLAEQPSWLRWSASGRHAGLLTVAWRPLPEGDPTGDPTGEPGPPLDLTPPPDAPEDPALRADLGRRLARELAGRAGRLGSGDRLVVLTRCAVTTGPDDAAPDPAQYPIWAEARRLRPRLPGRLVLVDLAAGTTAPAGAIDGAEPEVAVRRGEALVPRLVPVPAEDRPWPLAGRTPGGSVVVTGTGTAAGAALARRLVAATGARHALVVGPAPAADELGPDVEVVTVAPAGLRRALDALPGPTTAILHASSDTEVGRALHQATTGMRTAAFIATGPADAEALVHTRRATGLPATFIDGDASGLPAALDAALGLGIATLLATRPELPPPGADVPPLLRELAAARSGTATPVAATPAELLRSLTALDEPGRLALLRDLVAGHTGAVLGAPAAADHDRAFRDFGLTSAAVVELRNRLTAATGLALPATVTFNHPTIDALATHLHARLTGSGGTTPEPVAQPASGAVAGDPIAIVGMACRLPGDVSSPADLWRLVLAGGEGVTGFPDDRGWDLANLFDTDPGHAGTSYVARGGFLSGAAGFDAAFFGISPREALAMDPQQRLLLETSWEALDHAGLDPGTLRGADVGVFTGVMGHGPAPDGQLPPGLEGFQTTGTAASVASGRVSYVFGFEGPAVSVDTACSSSLVAIHLAAQALRSGECSMALAGGATVMTTPGAFVEFSRQRALAPDGRCKSYADAADGTGWAEGAGVVVLEPLSVAQARGHRVLAVLRGSALNQDGASNGLTAPSGVAQQRVIRRALAGAGLDVTDVDVVEGHGTGTVLGDPIEAEALLATYGQGRAPEHPLWLGSLKSNIGHTQAAAGVAGVIKMVQALRHGTLPPTLHADRPSSRVDWSAGAVRLITEAQPWPRTARPRRAGVSSFGVSGTNAHLILEEAPDETPREAGEAPQAVTSVVALPLSARTPAALAAGAGRLAAFVEAGNDTMADIAAALRPRALFDERAVVVAESAAEAATLLRTVEQGRGGPGTAVGSARPGPVVFVFPGQGAQWSGMGRDLLDTSPVFAAHVRACAAAAEPYADVPLIGALRGEVPEDVARRVDVVQIASFAMMTGLAAVWRSAGVEPSAVVGHSQGEIAAAYVAGALSLADAVRVVAVRAALVRDVLAGGGAMASVALSEAAATRRLAGDDRVTIAAVNSPGSVVVAGPPGALAEVLSAWEDDGVRVRRVAVDYASHTAQVELIAGELGAALAGVRARAPRVPLLSTVTGTWITEAEELAGDYWVRNLRHPVRFAPAVATLIERGHTSFVEVSAHPVLVQPVTEIVEEAGADVVVTESLRRDEGGLRRLAVSMGRLFVTGTAVDWAAVSPPARGRAELPPYAFDHRTYWLPATTSRPGAGPLGLTEPGHPLLGALLDRPVEDRPGEDGPSSGDGGLVAVARWSASSFPWITGRRADGATVLPATALLDVVMHAGDRTGTPVVAGLSTGTPLVLPEHGALDIQVRVGGPGPHGDRTVELWGRTAGPVTGEPWTRYAHGLLTRAAAGTVPAALPEAGRVELDGEPGGYGLHPALLDAAVRTLVEPGATPVAWTGVTLHATGATALTAHGDGHRLLLTDPAGAPVLSAAAVTTGAAATAPAAGPPLFHTAWTGIELPPAAPVPDVRFYDVPAGDDPRTVLAEVLTTLRTWLTGPEASAGRLVVHTGDRDDVATSAVWGLVRSAQSEHPGRIVLVATDEQSRGRSSGVLDAALATGEPQIRVREGRAQVPRLLRVPAGGTRPARPLDPDGTVLITGGTGLLGGITARHLVARYGVRHLLLAARRGLTPEAGRLRDELAACGATVTVARCDVGDREQLRELLNGIPATAPLTAVVHAAGVLDDGVVTTLDTGRLDTVLRPKLDAARHLHELTLGHDLAAFVLYSSAAGVLGNPGQANYAAANAGLDALARERRRLGLPAVSVAWGFWTEAGGLTRHLGDADHSRTRRSGMLGLSTGDGMALLDAALLADTPPDVVATRFDPAGRAENPLLSALLPPARPRAHAASAAAAADPLAGLDESEQTGALLRLVRRHTAEVLGHDDPESVPADRPFRETGLDSLTAIELRNRLAADTGLKLGATVAFDYPRPLALAGYLRDRLTGRDTLPKAAPAVAAAPGEPIAIVAMACRFPAGVNSPEELWRLVLDGADAVTGFPDDRGWPADGLFHPDPDHPGTTYVRHGAFLDDAPGFDAAFFGISPNEALAMDPQQRILLETSWELLERAGIDPAGLHGRDVGVFAGVNSHDYSLRAHRSTGAEGFRLTGSSGSVVSGRIAYHYGFEGPAITVDTACSSSLVALHLAVRALQQGECSLALAGGVTVIGTVETFVEFSRQRGLAPDGRCKSFAEAADGTGWSEGAGLLLVERLSDARRNGHQVLAVVRGSAVNSDGASNGLTAPSGPAQQRVITSALAGAGLTPAEVDAVEAHGTGTTLGDPIEAQALIETYGRDRDPERPLWLGSVKSNLGHTQAAAGVAGVIKMVMAMRHGTLPATLHVDRPSSHIDWSAGTVRLLTEARDWPDAGRPRRAGVSSFGIGGTNAHVVLEAGPAAEAPPSPAPDPAVVPVLLSAHTASGLRGQAARLAGFLAAAPDARTGDVAHALTTARAHLGRRAVILTTGREHLTAELRDLERGTPGAATVSGTTVAGSLAVVFAGQGSQRAGMGAGLSRSEPVFAEAFTAAITELERHLGGHGPRPLADVLAATPGTPDAALLDRTLYTQPALFALETALYRLLAAWGVRPAMLAGHSIGEIAAAHVAGILDLGQAARLVAARARLMDALPGGGAMTAVRATPEQVATLLRDAPGNVGVAAVNSPDSLVLAGEQAAVDAIADQLRRDGHRTRQLNVSHAFHSALMEPVLDEFGAVAAALTYRPATVPIVSTVTGRLDADGEMSTAGYWVRQLRHAVRFGDAVATLRAEGTTTFLEAGPGNALTGMLLEAPGLTEDACLPLLPSGPDEPLAVRTAVAGLHVRGIAADWPAILARTGPAPLGTELPTYAFEHQRFWIGTEPDETAPLPAAAPVLPATARDLSDLTGLVAESALVALGHRPGTALDHRVSFKDLGLDSLGAVRLRNRLRDLTGVEMPVTVVFDHPTTEALAAHLSAALHGDAGVDAGSGVHAGGGADEPIAIIATSGRFPGGADSPEALWTLVAERRDAITEFPAGRDWDVDRLYHPDPAHPGTSYTRAGGFLHDADRFDAALFGISPREALAMDPQQRLLLETSWEAFERAGIDPLALRGRDVGVYTGIVHHDYVTRLRQVPEDVQGYVMTGTAASVASGRVSYVFGFEGPAVTVDTACSSSLVAIHLAAQALRSGECSMALAGGATVMASPDPFLEFSRQRGLAADGRCKSYSSDADGTGWGEGAGMVVLERLSDARRNGHRVLAVLRGSAVNQDGASNGLTAPSGPAQQRVIRRALAEAGLDAADVDVVEGHGTGTVLGDPIEIQALMATYGKGRAPEHPLWLGSLKSNIGHTQAAAGVAGVIKMVEALRHGVLPASLHAGQPTSQVDWSAGTVRVLAEERDWPRTPGRPRRAAVSSFGASGTNAHLVIEEAPGADPAPTGDPGVVALTLSAKTPASLRAQATRLAAMLTADPDVPLASVATALATRRAVLGERAAVVAGTAAEALPALHALARGERDPGLVSGTAAAGKLAWVFPGQGAQWPGMGRELLAESPVFAARVADCVRALQPWLDWPLLDVLRGDAEPAMFERVDVVQVTTFTMMVSLAAVWSSAGVVPDAVIGHSQGEIAAACVAGALSLDDAARVVVLRSQVIAAKLAGGGGMASAVLTEAEADARLRPWAGSVEVAVVNSPASLVLAGEPGQLDAALDRMTADGVRVRRVAVDYASHTRHVETVRDALAEAFGDVRSQAPAVPMRSTLTGGWVRAAGELDGDYWYRNLRGRVSFGPAVTALVEEGFGFFVEMSPHPVLVQPVTECAEAAGRNVSATGSLRRDDGGMRRLLTSIAELGVAGITPRWPAVLPAAGGWVDLPVYAFDRQAYWLREPAAGEVATGADDAEVVWAAVRDEDPRALAAVLGAGDPADLESLARVLPLLARWRAGQESATAVEGLRYRTSWQPFDNDAAGVPAGRWLVVAPTGEAVDGFLAELTAQGLTTVTVRSDDGTAPALGADREFAGVLSLLALGAGNDLVTPAMNLVRALGDAGLTAPLWILTRGAVDVGIRDAVTAAHQAALWGLGMVVALEHPDRWGGLVDLPGTDDRRTVPRVLAALTGAAGEDQIAVRRSGTYARRLVRATAPVPAPDGWQPSGTVLVTGGDDGLGRYACRWLAGAGARRLIVTTTGGDPLDAADRVRADLAGTGVPVEVCDGGDHEEILRLMSAAADLPLTAVVHAADRSCTGAVADTGEADVARMFAAKVDPAVWLDETLADTPLDAFVVFTSIAGVWGGGGQGLSAAANATLDALVAARRARGLRATSVAWGVLEQIGIGADEAAVAQLRRRGVLPLTIALAMDSLARATGADETAVTVAAVDWPAFVPAFTSVRPTRLFDSLPEARAALSAQDSAAPAGGPDGTLVDSLQAAPEAERDRMLLRLVRGHAAAVLGHSSGDAVAAEQPFQDAGFDSLAAVNLRNSLNTATGLRLPSTLIFDYPTPAALVAHLRDELLSEPAPPEADEATLRRVLAAVPLDRFARAGVLDTLIALASGTPADEPDSPPAEDDLIDEMDVADLVRRALGTSH